MAKKDKEKSFQFLIPELNYKKVKVFVVGTEPLLLSQFPSDVMLEIQRMLERDPRDGKERRKAALPALEHINRARFLNSKNQDCIPSFYFKASMGRAAANLPGNENGKIITKEKFRGAVHMAGGLLPLLSTPFEVDMRPVPGSNKNTRVPSFRPCYQLWGTSFVLEYDHDLLTPERVFTLLMRAGSQCGVGANRIGRGGENGRYRPVTEEAYKAFAEETHKFMEDLKKQKKKTVIDLLLEAS
jgi:hypothetical protein